MSNNNSIYTSYAYNNADDNMQSIIVAVNTVKARNPEAAKTLHSWIMSAQDRMDDAAIAQVVCTAVDKGSNADLNNVMSVIRDGLRKAAGK